MKILFNWVKEYVPYEGSPTEAAALLERLGFEVTSVTEYGKNLSGVVRGEVLEVGRHPNADRLSLCKVSDGVRDYSVVCGAPNVRAGIRVPFAKLGAKLPNGLEIKATKIRGVESQGMICSAAELGLEEKSDGILILPEGGSLNEDIREPLGLDDTLIEIDVTPNRRDALSIIGVAREIAAGSGLPLKYPEPRARELDMTHPIHVLNEAQDLCPRYIARLVRDVKMGPSPEWMARRLTRCGIRSINNLVDITNYVLLELGQPLHAFDAVKMKGRHVRIRRAKPGEKILLLDERTVELDEGMCVIADDVRPAALAGVMGGEESAVTEDTQEIILESAAFEPSHIRKNAKAIATSTESSYRFERGTDWNMVALASRRATQLIQDLAGGLTYKPVEASGSAPAQPVVKLRTDRIRTFLGIDMKDSLAADYLRRLGCVINTGTGHHAVNVPSWRLDLTQEADLLEEIARLHGYDQIPERNPSFRTTEVPDDAGWNLERNVAHRLAGMGCLEACSTSFLSRRAADPFTPGYGQPADARPIAIANPLSLEQEVLRTSLLPALLADAQLNLNRQASGVQLFEIGRTFYEDHDGRHEMRRAGIVLCGALSTPHWRKAARSADFHDITGLLEALLGSLHIPQVHRTTFRSHTLHPKRSGILLSGSTPLAWYGELHPDLADSLDLKAPVVMAELNLSALREVRPDQLSHKAASAFPPVRRDLSILLEEKWPHDKIHRAIHTAAGHALESATLIDLFQGDKIGAGKKSMTYSLVFRHAEKTLADAEVDQLMSKTVTDLDKKFGATLRK